VRVIVCGSRDFDADHIMTEALDELCNMGDVVIVHGAARGADALASAWAKLERGWRRGASPGGVGEARQGSRADPQPRDGCCRR
jgi:hypothetical protein